MYYVPILFFHPYWCTFVSSFKLFLLIKYWHESSSSSCLIHVTCKSMPLPYSFTCPWPPPRFLKNMHRLHRPHHRHHHHLSVYRVDWGISLLRKDTGSSWLTGFQWTEGILTNTRHLFTSDVNKSISGIEKHVTSVFLPVKRSPSLPLHLSHHLSPLIAITWADSRENNLTKFHCKTHFKLAYPAARSNCGSNNNNNSNNPSTWKVSFFPNYSRLGTFAVKYSVVWPWQSRHKKRGRWSASDRDEPRPAHLWRYNPATLSKGPRKPGLRGAIG